MKLIIFVGCLFIAAVVGQTDAGDNEYEGQPKYENIPMPPQPPQPGPSTQPPMYEGQFTYTGPPTRPPKYTGPPTPSTKSPTTLKTTTTAAPVTEEANKSPCGSNSVGDYRGSCDDSVPVIIMPKGRPIMERVLDWFKCGTKSCLPEKPST